MNIAKVIGNVVATKKDEGLVGKKMMIVSLMKNNTFDREHLEVAVDTVGAGIGEIVLVVTGGAARQAANADYSVPTDMAIVGIVDDMDISAAV